MLLQTSFAFLQQMNVATHHGSFSVAALIRESAATFWLSSGKRNPRRL